MTTTLLRLQGLVRTYSAYNFNDISTEEIVDLQESAADMISTMIWVINEKVSGIEQKSIVQQLQFELTRTADSITKFEREQPQSDQLSDFLKFLMRGIYRIVDYLRIYFPADFNFDAKLPIHYTWLEQSHREAILCNYPDVLAKLEIEPDLYQLLEQFFSTTGNQYQASLTTWRHLQFQNVLLKELTLLAHTERVIDMNLEILKLFVAFEFNTLQAYSYFVSYLERLVTDKMQALDQHEALIYSLKVFKQVRIEAGISYDPAAPSLKSSFIECIEAEIAYLEQKGKLYEHVIRSENETVSRFYFKVAITLAELMFLLKVSLETQFISTRFKSSIYEFVSNHIQTERADNISKKSMRNHFSNKMFSEKVVRVVRGWLLKLIDHIEHHYND